MYFGGNVMDTESGQEIPRKLDIETNNRLLFSKGMANSPSPYDFCNHNRSDDDDDYNDEGSGGSVSCGATYQQGLEEDAAGDHSIEHGNVVTSHGDKDCTEKTDVCAQCFHKESELSGGVYVEEPEEAFTENSLFSSLYKEPLASNDKDSLLDVENNASLWVAPPPADDEDQFDSIEEDDDTYSDEWCLSDSVRCLGSSKVRSKDTFAFEHRKAVVTGHFRVMVGQLLSREGIHTDENGLDSWLEIVTSLSLQAAGTVKPDTSVDGGMDPGGYIKVKVVAAGRPAESQLVRGIICKKNIAHRRMIARFKAPRLLLLGGSVELQTVSNHLSSLETLLQKELGHISWAISMIEEHRPNVLLVEKTVSRQAQELLLAKGISLVLNVKRSLLERISRCTGATIARSIENLTSTKVGHCEHFYVEKYHQKHSSAAQGAKGSTKTLMFFEDCPKPFGCSILLKGGNFNELKKVKKAVKLAVFAAYHLALETSFLADEGVDLPEPCLKSPLSVAPPDSESKPTLSMSTAPHYGSSMHDDSSLRLITSQSDTSSLMTATSTSRIPSADKDSTASSPGLHEAIGATFGKLSEAMALDNLGLNMLKVAACVMDNFTGDNFSGEKAFEVLPAVEQSAAKEVSTDTHTGFSSEEQKQAISIPEEGKSVDNSLQTSKGEKDAPCPSEEEFPPSPKNYQNILVSFSSSCLRKGTVCERGHLFRIRYYGTFDKPLGKFLRETLFDQTHKCPACGELKDAHVDCYTHKQGSLTISVHKQSESLAGESEGKIWMWHRCLKCPRVDGIPPATRRLVMSDAAWGLSFGKFLELSFSNHAAHSRVASCGHSLHQDCLRFYGFGNMVACIRYSPVHVFSVYLPPSKLHFHCFEHQTWIQQEIKEIAEKGDHLFKDVFFRLQNMHYKLVNIDGKSNDAKTHILELRDILEKQKDSFQRALNDAASCRGVDQPHADILRLNFIRRSLSNCSNLWDKRLQCLTSSLKSQRTFPGFDSGLIGDSLLSFLRDLSFGHSRNRSPSVSKEPSVAGSPKSDSQGTMQFLSEKGKSFETITWANNIDVSRGGLDNVPVSHSAPSSTEGTLVSPLSPGKASENINSVAGMGERLRSCITLSEGSNSQPATMTRGADVLGEGHGVHRSLSEGHFSCFRDVSATFDAAWTGESQYPVEFEFGLSSIGNVKGNVELDLSFSEGSKSSSDTSDESSSEHCTLTSPAKSGVPSDIESWVGIPYLSFQGSHNDNGRGSLPKTTATVEAQLANFPTIEKQQAQKGVTVSVFSDIDEPVVSVYDDEPTSVIAYAITSHEHQVHLLGKGDKQKDRENEYKDRDSENMLPVLGAGISHNTLQRLEGKLEHGSLKKGNSSRSFESPRDDPLLDSRASHAKVEFTDDTTQGRIKYTVTCYYAKQFDSLRKRCCKIDLDFIRSLCRCKKWGAQGGKSNVFFAKTADDRFVVKQVTRTELDSFITFAPAYFKYMSDAVPTGSPTCLAKIFGIYRVTVKHVKGGKELRMDLMIMENLLYGREVTRVYDLKGSLRSRYIADATAKNAVLLDQNLLESMQTSPIFISSKAKKLLERAVWNDTAFLASVDVMDYSLLVGVDEGRRELVLGIIDFMRQYTWDKHLETWVKESGILGGPKNTAPTVISPMQYKKRFRKAMSTYFLMLPDQW